MAYIVDRVVICDAYREPDKHYELLSGGRSRLGIEVPEDEFRLRLESDPFPVGRYQRIAVKVVDVYGNESTVVRELTS